MKHATKSTSRGRPLALPAAEMDRTTRRYRESLERMLATYEDDVRSLADLLEVRRDLRRRGIISAKEVELAEALLTEAQAKVEEAKGWIRDADKIIEEAKQALPADEK
jgi:multidrug resistance efflux pump